MMGIRELNLLIWVSSVCSLVCMSSGFIPVDNYLIDCGSLKNTSVGNRVFVADNSGSRILSTPKNIFANTTSSNSIQSAFGSPLYLTARIFNGVSSYSFPIRKQGRHWIRLHFFPFVYQNYNMSSANFSVTSQQFVLLSDFQQMNGPLVKEYSVNITANNLILKFIPSDKSFAFLNALEVVSLPDELITDDAQTVSTSENFQGLWRQALETVYRVNMGGPMISPSNDTLGRAWETDQGYLLHKNLAKSISNIGAVNYVDGGPTPDIAPIAVYGTASEMNTAGHPNRNFNVTWQFDVDPGFDYLIRFHFCDIVSSSLNELYFNVYINAWDVAPNLDLSSLTINALAAPYYMDLILMSSDISKLKVSVGPSTSIKGIPPNAILNGLEVLKMNNSRGSLDAVSFEPPFSFPSSKNTAKVIVLIVIGVIVLVVLAVAILVMHRRRQARYPHSKIWAPFSINGGKFHSVGSKLSNGTTASAASNYSYRIPFTSLLEATNNFDENWVIGVGGFGKVYRGVLKDGTKVAVKRGNPQSQQGLAEFRTEIEMLSQFRHRHLVSLIGYCDEQNEMILIYEYMENGTLKSHLYGSELPSLSWKQRLEICIGSARGLHYLHTGYSKAIIHRDVKSANILLDEKLMAKVADFGLSKVGPEIDQTHVTTAVKGSFGYLDPEYLGRQQLTEKSDVYSFGVVLFEVLCGRPVVDQSRPKDMVNLIEWATKRYKSGQLEQIIDPNLAGKVRPDSLRKFVETAEKCLANYGVDRPTMGDVLWNLEYALQLQETIIENDTFENSTNQIGELSPIVNNANLMETSVPGEQFRISTDDSSRVSMSRVFSQLVKAEGR